MVAAGAARGAPFVSARARMVARGQLASSAISDGGDARALVVVRVAGGAARLLAAGFDARALTDEFAAVRAGADELRALAALDGVQSIEERRLLYPTLDQSAALVGAPAARAATGLDGSGVLVGVVDTGVDFRHADLRAADGTTRVLALLDLAAPRDPRHHPEIPDYAMGEVWLADEIDAVLAAEAAGMSPATPIGERDSNGHGTHVAAIATSNGRAAGRRFPAGRYTGIAPGAALVVAQTTHGGSSFTDADVLAGCRFVIDRAAALGRPLVVNLSLGGEGGPHDGSSSLETALESLFPLDVPGRALVVAAGNDGARDLHARAWSVDGEVVFPLRVEPSTAAGSRVAVELWYRGALAITVETPAGKRYGPVAVGASLADPNDSEGTVTVDDATGGPRADGLMSAGVVVTGASGAAPATGTWRILLDGSAARADAWVVDSPPGVPFARFLDHVDVDERMAQPATGRSVISVGSLVSKSDWTDRDGMPVSRGLVLGDVSGFSSSGPTADGRFAPDLIAPGEFIAAALSADAPPDQSTSAFFAGAGQPLITWADDGVHGLLHGTSQAAPHVTGAVALLLEANPALTSGALREILRATTQDGGVGFSPRHGFGRLDVLAAARYVGGARGGAVSPSLSSVGVSRDALPPGDDTTTVTVTPRDAAGAPLGPGHAVTIDASAGAPLGPVSDAGAGRYERTFAAHASRGTVASIAVTVDGVALDAHPSIFFVVDRSEIGRPFTAAGGCSLDRTRPGEPRSRVWWLLAALAALVAAAAWRARNSRRAARRSTLGG